MIEHFLPQFLLLHGSYYYLIFFKLVFYSSNSLFYSPASYKRKWIMESMKIIRTPKHIFVLSTRMKRTNVVGLSQRKMIKTEETAKVVASVWGA